VAGAYSAGFQTTALPHNRAGTRYQEGTATGKLPAVTTAATPTGCLKVNSCLSGISLGTVWPYRRRPSPRKKSQVSTISWTSPRDSASGLPISRLTSRARASRFSSTRRPRCLTARPLTGAGVAAQPGCAARAAPQASTKVAGSASSTSATISPVWAGLVEATTRPPSARRPPMREASGGVVVVGVMLGRLSCPCRCPRQP
jgi:hypothetical protein